MRIRYLMPLLGLILIAFVSCRMMRVERGDANPSGEVDSGEKRTPSPRTTARPTIAPSRNVYGFATAGGISRNPNYILISDPSGTFSNTADLGSSDYAGAIGILPEEMVIPQ